ncbi:MAG: YcxB family protein [Mucilaginibacter sp.]
MTIHTKLAFKDFLGLQFLLVYKKPAFIVLSMFGLGMLCFSVLYFLGFWQKGSLPVFQLLFSAFTLIFLPFSIYRSAINQFKANSHLQEALTYTFGQREVEIKGETFISFLPWSKTYMVEELSTWILIYQDNRVLNVIPKRFVTESELNAFRHLIKNVPGLNSKLKI